MVIKVPINKIRETIKEYSDKGYDWNPKIKWNEGVTEATLEFTKTGSHQLRK